MAVYRIRMSPGHMSSIPIYSYWLFLYVLPQSTRVCSGHVHAALSPSHARIHTTQSGGGGWGDGGASDVKIAFISKTKTSNLSTLVWVTAHLYVLPQSTRVCSGHVRAALSCSHAPTHARTYVHTHTCTHMPAHTRLTSKLLWSCIYWALLFD